VKYRDGRPDVWGGCTITDSVFTKDLVKLLLGIGDGGHDSGGFFILVFKVEVIVIVVKPMYSHLQLFELVDFLFEALQSG